MRKISFKSLSLKKKNRVFLKKIKLVFSHAYKKIHHFFKRPKFFKKTESIFTKIRNNKLLNSPYFFRVIVICFFFGLNLILLPHFLQTTRVHLPNEILDVLDTAGVLNKDDYVFEYIPPELKGKDPSLEPAIIWEKLNEQREVRGIPALNYSEKLATAAAELLLQAEKIEYEIEDQSFIEELRTALDSVEYEYSHVSHNMVVGPLLEDAVIDAWFSDEEQIQAVFGDDFLDVGFASKIITKEDGVTLGVVVQILGKEFPQKPAVALQNTLPSKPTQTMMPYISNQEVFEALNRYRNAHTVPSLNENEELCKYADKRVLDLMAFGTLDNHDGFKKDFEDPENLPGPIRRYPGKKIAENLAYQNCKNMTTGDSFVAQTGTAIIEWCFDSSTAGHREAQLNREFSNACVRSGNNMFVIIFGD